MTAVQGAPDAGGLQPRVPRERKRTKRRGSARCCAGRAGASGAVATLTSSLGVVAVQLVARTSSFLGTAYFI